MPLWTPASFGNMRWQDMFTDPMLADLIGRALVSNVNLQNAKLNVDMAHSQLKGARLQLSSVAYPRGLRQQGLL